MVHGNGEVCLQYREVQDGPTHEIVSNVWHPKRIRLANRLARKTYRVIMTFDLSWGGISRRNFLTHRTNDPRAFLARVRTYGYYARNRFIPPSRLIQARVEEVKA